MEVTYAGSAPGLVSGALQVNVRIPSQFQPPTYYTCNVAIATGGVALASPQIYVKPSQ